MNKLLESPHDTPLLHDIRIKLFVSLWDMWIFAIKLLWKNVVLKVLKNKMYKLSFYSGYELAWKYISTHLSIFKLLPSSLKPVSVVARENQNFLEIKYEITHFKAFLLTKLPNKSNQTQRALLHSFKMWEVEWKKEENFLFIQSFFNFKLT